MQHHGDTIAAIATPPGIGGIGIVRVSGPRARSIAEAVTGRVPRPRYATCAPFRNAERRPIDAGIAIYFPGPASFTGEDVLELQGHGGPVVLDLVLASTLQSGARLARPGEFSERAFLNGKIDLVQAESVADLIEARTAEAARLAGRTLQGEFSRRVRHLVDELTRLRAYVEAAIDFPDEDVDFLSDSKVSTNLRTIVELLDATRTAARQGRLLRDGMTLVIAGLPNAGKSSLLNVLTGREAAIVTAIPGTTRDLLRERIQIDGMPLHIVDTAGLRGGGDALEREGIRRARAQIDRADRILWVLDDAEDPAHDALDRHSLPDHVPVTLVRNKIDLTGTAPGFRDTGAGPEIAIATTTGAGIDDLRQHLKASAGYQGVGQGEFMARRRHLDALERSAEHLAAGADMLSQAAGELLAEELRLAQNALAEITGEFYADDLLGAIFGSFCIGK